MFYLCCKHASFSFQGGEKGKTQILNYSLINTEVAIIEQLILNKNVSSRIDLLYLFTLFVFSIEVYKSAIPHSSV